MRNVKKQSVEKYPYQTWFSFPDHLDVSRRQMLQRTLHLVFKKAAINRYKLLEETHGVTVALTSKKIQKLFYGTFDATVSDLILQSVFFGESNRFSIQSRSSKTVQTSPKVKKQTAQARTEKDRSHLSLAHSLDHEDFLRKIFIPVIYSIHGDRDFAETKRQIGVAISKSSISNYAVLDQSDGYEIHLASDYEHALFLLNLHGDCHEERDLELELEDPNDVESVIFQIPEIFDQLNIRDLSRVTTDQGKIIMSFQTRGAYVTAMSGLLRMGAEKITAKAAPAPT